MERARSRACFVCAFLSACRRFVSCVFLRLSVSKCLQYIKEGESGAVRGGGGRDVDSLAHYGANALCFLSTRLCQTRGSLFSLPGPERRSGQAPTWCSSALAQFTRSLAPQTLLLASSRFSPSALASQQQMRNQSVGMRWLHSDTLNG